MSELREVAARALGCLDLTNLDEGCTAGDIAALCDRARTPHGPVAAVCVYPRFAAQAKAALQGSGIRVATVVNFPSGDRPADFVQAMVGDVLDEGADEIDFVIPYRALMAGNSEPVRAMARLVRRAAPDTPLKAILETGALKQPDLIEAAARIAVEEGVDFLKTSTGKVPVNATPEAAEILLGVIRDAPRPVGFKAAGGVRTTGDAATYLGLADRVMGAGWARPETFRIGASGVLSALLATLEGTAAPGAGEGY
jgi:deoxyribose-phosphate aldolase